MMGKNVIFCIKNWHIFPYFSCIWREKGFEVEIGRSKLVSVECKIEYLVCFHTLNNVLHPTTLFDQTFVGRKFHIILCFLSIVTSKCIISTIFGDKRVAPLVRA